MKRIVVCFDGTWVGGLRSSTSNVGRLSVCIPRLGPDGVQQLVLYLPGVGTAYKADKYFGGAFGLGLDQAVMTGYRFLVANYEPKDHIFLFGFSRGAFAARCLASMRVVQDATKEARIRANEEVRAQIRDFEERVAGIWETRTPQDAAEETRRMSLEFTKRVVDAYTEAEGKPSGTPSS